MVKLGLDRYLMDYGGHLMEASRQLAALIAQHFWTTFHQMIRLGYTYD